MRSRYGLVVEVTADGQPLVFRGSPDPGGVHQGRVTAALARLGVSPAVHAFIETTTGTWTIAERISPGTPIGDMDPTAIDIEMIGTALRPLAGQPAPAADMATLTDWLRSRLTDDSLNDLAPGSQTAPIEQRQRALAVLDELEATGSMGLCHGDASPWNLLLGNDRRLMLIDPRGVAGEVAYDLAVVAINAASVMPPAMSVPCLAREGGADPEHVLAWLTVAEAARV